MAATAVGAGILISRLAGLIRVSLFAKYLGQRTEAADAFNAAFRIPGRGHEGQDGRTVDHRDTQIAAQVRVVPVRRQPLLVRRCIRQATRITVGNSQIGPTIKLRGSAR